LILVAVTSMLVPAAAKAAIVYRNETKIT
jgi:hypothetical protein